MRKRIPTWPRGIARPEIYVLALSSIGLATPALSFDSTDLPIQFEAKVIAGGAATTPDHVAFAKKTQAWRDAAAQTDRIAPEIILSGLRDRTEIFAKAQQLGLQKWSDIHHLASPLAVEKLSALTRENGDSFLIRWHEEESVPRFIAGKNLLPQGSASRSLPAEDIAAVFLEEQKVLLRLDNPAVEMEVSRIVEAQDGFQAVRFNQSYAGRKVWARDVVVRLNPEGSVIGFSGQHVPSDAFPSLQPSVGEARAAEVAVAAMRGEYGADPIVDSTELLYFPHQETIFLAWQVVTSSGLTHRDDVFVDALTGEVIHTITRVYHDGPVSGSGTGLSGATFPLDVYQVGSEYTHVNATKPMYDAAGSQVPNGVKGGIQILDARNDASLSSVFHIVSTNPNSWAETNAVSAAYYAGRVYDYYYNVHNRNAIDGNGTTMTAIVNIGQNHNNASWNGAYMLFGNGDGTTFSDLAGSFDVTAHEMTHGVTDHSANLVYEFQSGALNEHFSDALGVAADFAMNDGQANWLLGEEVTTPQTAGDCLRNMMDPGAANVAFGPQPRDMSEFRDLPSSEDSGGVHINSGIPNRAFYIASVDQGLGVEKASKIWYHALTQSLTRNSQFVDFRLATIQAATDLYGAADAQKVANAMDAIGLLDGDPNTPPGDLPDNPGAEYLAVVDVESGTSTFGHVYRVPFPDLDSFTDMTMASISAGGRPSFTDDGSIFVWVGADNNVRVTRTDGKGTVAITEDGQWHSVAINADGSRIAATTTNENGIIYIVDTATGQVTPITLQSHGTSDGDSPDNVVFADVMEFSVNGEYLIYDALNRATIGEQPVEYWDISALRVGDQQFFRVLPPLPAGQSVGNPSFSQNNDSRMAFDYVNENGQVVIYGYDFETSTTGVITGSTISPGRPTFSVNDTAVYFEQSDGQTANIVTVTLNNDGITGGGDDTVAITGGAYPVSYTVGSRPSPILLSRLAAGWQDAEIQLEWGVPDSDLFIAYEVERSVESGEFDVVVAVIDPVVGESGVYRLVDIAPEAGDVLDYRVYGAYSNGGRELLGELRVRRGENSSANAQLALSSVVPNPVRTFTSFRIAVPQTSEDQTSLTVYDVGGRVVARPLAATQLQAGIHQIDWDVVGEGGIRVASGIYYVKLTQGREEVTRRISILR